MGKRKERKPETTLEYDPAVHLRAMLVGCESTADVVLHIIESGEWAPEHGTAERVAEWARELLSRLRRLPSDYMLATDEGTLKAIEIGVLKARIDHEADRDAFLQEAIAARREKQARGARLSAARRKDPEIRQAALDTYAAAIRDGKTKETAERRAHKAHGVAPRTLRNWLKKS